MSDFQHGVAALLPIYPLVPAALPTVHRTGEADPYDRGELAAEAMWAKLEAMPGFPMARKERIYADFLRSLSRSIELREEAEARPPNPLPEIPANAQAEIDRIKALPRRSGQPLSPKRRMTPAEREILWREAEDIAADADNLNHAA